jgi:ATP-binding cassette subfamily B protein
LIRFYDPTKGMIRLGDGVTQVDLRCVPQSDLRRRIGVVTQQVQLFNSTVRNNLTLFDHTVQDEEIRFALEAVGLQNWLHDLPDGLDSHIAAHGSVSAGQAQLLAFGRVFLMNPQLIILDEASSRLDPATEQRIEQALDRLLANRTAVIVAHRLATVHRAHEIMILDQGRILEHDQRARLLADPTSHFSQLLRIGLAEAIA